jgi:hypothetical protein
VLQALADGLTYEEMAAQLGIQAGTARHHAFQAYRRLGVRGARPALVHCLKAGWLDPGSGIESMQLRRVERLLSDLAAAVRRPVRSRNRPLSFRERSYLEAFDDLLSARSDDDKAAARAAMTRSLHGVLAQAGVPDRPRRRGDLVELLVGYAARSASPSGPLRTPRHI